MEDPANQLLLLRNGDNLQDFHLQCVYSYLKAIAVSAKILEASVLFNELQFDDAGWPIALLGDDDIGSTCLLTAFALLVKILSKKDRKSVV